MAPAFIATLSSQPIGMELCPASLIDYQDPQKANRTARYLPEVRPFSLLCAQPHTHAQSEQSPEWDCLLRLPPPLFPSTDQVGSRWCNQIHIHPAHAHSGMWPSSKFMSSGWILSVPKGLHSLLSLRLQSQNEHSYSEGHPKYYQAIASYSTLGRLWVWNSPVRSVGDLPKDTEVFSRTQLPLIPNTVLLLYHLFYGLTFSTRGRCPWAKEKSRKLGTAHHGTKVRPSAALKRRVSSQNMLGRTEKQGARRAVHSILMDTEIPA